MSKLHTYSYSFIATLIISLFTALSTTHAQSNSLGSSGTVRAITSLDNDWRFIHADTPGAEVSSYNDSTWRTLNLPHDWSIEGPFDKSNPTGGAGGFLPAGTGWYRKTFTLDSSEADRNTKLSIEFDGVMANSDVWINGYHLGQRPYGYSSFSYELTGHLLATGENVIAVRVDNSGQPASRWYTGAGIYRHVRLVRTSTVHLSHWSTFVATVDATTNLAHVKFSTQVANDSDRNHISTVIFELKESKTHRLLSSVKSKSVLISSHSTQNFSEIIAVENPSLWSLENPTLYIATTRVTTDDDSKSLDNEDTTIGIRTFIFDSEKGFSLNGKNFKLKGVCLHADGSAFGAAVPQGVWELRLKALKTIGVNAIRTAHNPPAPEFLDLCDQLGILVMDETFDCWTIAKNPFDYHLYFEAWNKIDAQDMVLRDRNHPSIILWSAGNEIHDTPKTQLAHRILSDLVNVIHHADPTRPVTQALFRPNVSHDYDNGLADLLDVVGTNYRFNELLAAHEAKPTRKIIGTENGHELPAWLAVRDNPEYCGEFIWSGIDYLGESRAWPMIASASGLLDRTAYPHPDGSIFQSWWSDTPSLFVARRVAPTPQRPTDPGYETTPTARRRVKVLCSDWNPKLPTPHIESVEVYSNCEEVELFLNEKSLGTKFKSSDLSPRLWKVEYTPGKLVAIARNNGKIVSQNTLATAGKPTHIKLSAVRSTITQGSDDKVICVSAEVTDDKGVVVPNADNQIKFSTNKSGLITAVDSADNSSHEAFQTRDRKAYEGRCVAYVKQSGAENGPIVINATSDDLAPARLDINAP